MKRIDLRNSRNGDALNKLKEWECPKQIHGMTILCVQEKIKEGGDSPQELKERMP